MSEPQDTVPIRHVEYDCTTKEERWRDATAEEVAELLARQKAHAERTGAQLAQREADVALVLAKTAQDPAFAALVRLAGIRLT